MNAVEFSVQDAFVFTVDLLQARVFEMNVTLGLSEGLLHIIFISVNGWLETKTTGYYYVCIARRKIPNIALVAYGRSLICRIVRIVLLGTQQRDNF